MNTRHPVRAELLDLVNRSPAAVAVHDRRAWVALFARHSVVEDPVGSRPHVSGVFDARAGCRGAAPLERFFDTFIAPNAIRFEVTRDAVCADCVARDLTIAITMAEGVAVQVPMHLLYELRQEAGAWRIARLAAHWELWPMVRQLLDGGRAAWPVLAQLGWRMLRIQGLGGMLGFSRGLRGIGQHGKAVVQQFAEAVNAGHAVRVFDLFATGNQGIAFPADAPACAPEHFLRDYPGATLRVEKLLAAGHTVSATVTVEQGGQRHQGMALFEFHAREKRLQRVDFYWDAEGSTHVGA